MPIEDFKMQQKHLSFLEKEFIYLGEFPDGMISTSERMVVYFFIEENEEKEKFRVYVGKSEKISNRMKDYKRGFSPNSPNDYKLQIFHMWMKEHRPDNKLQVYCKEIQSDEGEGAKAKALSVAEGEWISRFDPLVNNKGGDSMSQEILELYKKRYYHVFNTEKPKNVSKASRPDSDKIALTLEKKKQHVTHTPLPMEGEFIQWLKINAKDSSYRSDARRAVTELAGTPEAITPAWCQAHYNDKRVKYKTGWRRYCDFRLSQGK